MLCQHVHTTYEAACITIIHVQAEMERAQFQVCEQMVQSVSVTAFEFYARYLYMYIY